MTDAKLHVDISCSSDYGIGFIVSRPTGVVFTNQTAGYSCLHPSLEGLYIPLQAHPRNDPLENYGCFGGGALDDREAQTKLIKDWLKWAKLHKEFEPFLEGEPLMEAWIPVRVKEGLDEYSPVCGLMGATGVLTYQNSD